MQANDNLRYAGFWVRLASNLIDFIIFLPLVYLYQWGCNHWRLFMAYYFAALFFFYLFWGVFLVKRFGGTPGKLIMGIRIRKLNGDPAGYREAILRCAPELIFTLLEDIGLLMALFRMTEQEYFTLNFQDRAHRMFQLAPIWFDPLTLLQGVWVWSELIVLLTNTKRRALHDFIAGTVVVHAKTIQTSSPLPDARQEQAG